LRIFEYAASLAWVGRIFWFLPFGGAGRAIEMMNRPAEEEFHYQRPEGIPEADLTDEERKAAADRIVREDAIRRAKGE
jgi:hypothetical protein